MKRLFTVLFMCFCFAVTVWSDTTEANSGAAAYTDKVYPLERNGIALHLDCMTSDAAPVRDNILLVHGLTYSSHEFDVNYQDYSLVRFLCNHGYAVWRLDIAGYGQSGELADGLAVSSQYAAQDVEAAIEKIKAITNAADIDLLGWSWGTVTSALAAEKCYQDIDKYVMYAPILTGLGQVQVNEGYHANTWADAAGDFQVKTDGSIDGEIAEDAVVSTFCSNCWRYDGSASPNGGRRDLCVDTTSKLIDLAQIKNRTLIICGDKDPYLNMSLVKNSLANLPANSQLVIINGASHSLMLEKPYYHAFQQAVIEFLQEQ